MSIAPLSNESARLEALARYEILDTASEEGFDRITVLAARLFEVPIALVSLVAQERLWFKSRVGLDAASVDRDGAFCAHTIQQNEVFIVPDALADPRFCESPTVVGAPFVRFYAGAPLVTSDGFHLGALCLLDTKPRSFSSSQAAILRDLAALVVRELEARHTTARMALEISERLSAEARKRAVLDAALDGIITINHEGKVIELNRAAETMFGFPAAEAVGQELAELIIPPAYRAAHRRGMAHFLATGEGPVLNKRLELSAVRADGSEFPIELAITRIAADGPPVFTGHIRDISVRRGIEDRLRMLESSVDHANDAIVITEAEPVGEPGPRIIYVNQAFTSSTGYTADEVLGLTPRVLQGPDTNPETKATIRRALKRWKPVRVELLNYRKDGSEFWVELNIVPVANEKGWYTHWVSVQRDITERKQVEAEREERVRLAAMSAEIGLTLTRHDVLAEVLQRCAGVLVHRLGAAFARVWILNAATNILELQASAGLYTHLDGPHGRVPVGQFKIGLIAQERRPHLTNQVIGDPRVGDQKWARDNGMAAFAGYPLIVEEQVIGVMALFSREAISQPAFQALEAVANAMAVGIQHRLVQAEGVRLAKEVSLLLNSTSEGVCGVDPKGRVIFINRCGAQMLGYRPEELAGQPMHTLVHHHHADGSAYPAGDCPIGRVMRSGESVRVDGEVFWRQDGSFFPVEYACAPILEEGQIRGAVYTFADITARKQTETALLQTKQRAEQAQAEAERANAAKSEFLSRMSHELRTPLNAILGFGQLLEMDAQTDRQREKLSHILKGGKHLLGLINEVLDIARIESGKMELALEAVSVAEICQTAANLLRPLADQRNIRLGRCTGAACEGKLWADRQRLSQVVLNLLSNAVKYNRSGGSVHLTCEPAAGPGRLRLAVHDTGLGIAHVDLKKLFIPFERLGAEQSNVEGTGIGLALCKGLVEAMGGSIGVESTPGKGSTFYLELPSSTASVDINEHTPPPELQASTVGRHTVLCIEDNLSNFALVEQALEDKRPDIRLLGAMQGQLGLDMAREHQPDLILLDLQLPDLSGDKVLRLLQADPATREIPVIMVSADATNGQAQRLLDLGARDYLTKPLDIRTFLRTIDEVLTDRRALVLGSG